MLKNQILEIENLNFGYQKDNLLYKNFSLSINNGELISITGKSGTGKSTLFELITDELVPFSGNINVKSISQIFQDPYSSFHHSYTIINQIKDVAKFTENELNYFLLKLNIDKDLIYKKCFQLSGGQLQRCSILRVLLMKPNLILADEPTSALDNITALEVMKLLVSFLDKGIGILLITHDLELAKWCSDRIINIDKQ